MEGRVKIVAFLQNPWFKPGTDERHIIAYRDDQDFHRRVLSMCMTGQRLVAAFGDLYDQIHWDNTNWRPAFMASGREDPDYQHMLGVMKRISPDLVLCFGNQARDAMRVVTRLSNWGKEFLQCHHPNARFKTQQDLSDFADRVRRKILELELLGKEMQLKAEDADERGWRHES